MVRLKDPAITATPEDLVNFNSSMVRLKVLFFVIGLGIVFISIPVWYD